MFPSTNRWLGVLLVVGLALRMINLGAAQLWYDEAFSAVVASLDYSRLIMATAGDTHPPLYYLILAPLNCQAESCWRFPSVVASLALLPVLWFVLGDLGYSRRVQIGAAFLTTIMPAQIHYAQEARMYALFSLAFWLGLLGITRRQWWLFLGSMVGLLWLHNYGLFYAPVLFLLAWYLRPTDRTNILITTAMAGMSWLPWLVVLVGQMTALETGYWIQAITPGAVLYALWRMWAGFTLLERFEVMSVMVYSGLTIYPAWVTIKARAWHTWPLWLAGLGPLALALLASLVWQPVLLFRGLLPSAPALYALAVWAITRPRPMVWLKSAYALGLVAPVMLAGLYAYYKYIPINKGSTRQEIEHIRASWKPGDVVLHHNDGSWVLYAWYAPDLPQAKLVECGSYLGALTPLTRAAIGQREITAIPEGRYWTVVNLGPAGPSCEDDYIQPLLEDHRKTYNILTNDLIDAAVWEGQPYDRRNFPRP